jgi:hypothetical protein
MLEFKIPDDMRQIFVNTLGFDLQLIDEVVQTPDEQELVQFDEGRVTMQLFTQAFAGRRPSVVVVGIWTAPAPAKFEFALRLYNDFSGTEIHGRMPLDLVELAVRRFGAEMSIGLTKDRFFLRRSFP